MADYTLEKPDTDSQTCLRTKVIEGQIMWAKEGAHVWIWVQPCTYSNERMCTTCGRKEEVPYGRLA